jgi:hypothetical protein
MLERLLGLRLEKAGLDVTGRAALDELKTLTVAKVSLDGRQVRRRSEITPHQAKLLAAAGVHHVPEVWQLTGHHSLT